MLTYNTKRTKRGDKMDTESQADAYYGEDLDTSKEDFDLSFLDDEKSEE